jgi:hypothetical protein
LVRVFVYGPTNNIRTAIRRERAFLSAMTLSKRTTSHHAPAMSQRSRSSAGCQRRRRPTTRSWRSAGSSAGTSGRSRASSCASRAIFCSRTGSAGSPEAALSTYMGHSTITITLDRYGHHLPATKPKEPHSSKPGSQKRFPKPPRKFDSSQSEPVPSAWTAPRADLPTTAPRAPHDDRRRPQGPGSRSNWRPPRFVDTPQYPPIGGLSSSFERWGRGWGCAISGAAPRATVVRTRSTRLSTIRTT